MGADIAIIDREPRVARRRKTSASKSLLWRRYAHGCAACGGRRPARAILVCIDDPQAATRLSNTPKTSCRRVLARAHDREHAIALIKATDYQIRVTQESAMSSGMKLCWRWFRSGNRGGSDARFRGARMPGTVGDGGVRRHLRRYIDDFGQMKSHQG
ncbi:hypothetical protein M8494_31100 [Serratia ureilytica]